MIRDLITEIIDKIKDIKELKQRRKYTKVLDAIIENAMSDAELEINLIALSNAIDEVL